MSELRDCLNLPRLQWEAFMACPDKELSDCRPYEYTREVPVIRQAVMQWRAQSPDQSFEGLWALDACGCRSPLYHKVSSFWPEWPDDAYLGVPVNERERRLAILYPGEEDALIAVQLDPDPALLLDTEEGFHNVVRQLRKSWISDRQLELYPGNFESHELLKIPWWMSDSEIVQVFKTWLKVNSPLGRRLFMPQGAATFERRTRADLKALAALRVLRANGGDWTLPPALYAEQSEWISARNHATGIIQRLERAFR